MIALFSRDPNDKSWLLNAGKLFGPLLLRKGELQSRSREENVDEL